MALSTVLEATRSLAVDLVQRITSRLSTATALLPEFPSSFLGVPLTAILPLFPPSPSTTPTTSTPTTTTTTTTTTRLPSDDVLRRFVP